MAGLFEWPMYEYEYDPISGQIIVTGPGHRFTAQKEAQPVDNHDLKTTKHVHIKTGAAGYSVFLAAEQATYYFSTLADVLEFITAYFTEHGNDFDYEEA